MGKARDNVSKLRSFVFVNEPQYGVVGGGSVDDTAAIQACINANPGKFICFAPNTYRITSTLVVNTDNTFLFGFGRSATILCQTTNQDAFHFTSVASTFTSFLNNVGLEGLKIVRNSVATSGAGIRLTRCNTGHFTDFLILDCPEGIQIRGGQLNKLTQFEVFGSSSMSDLSAVTDSSLFKVDESATDGGTYQPAYTVIMSNFNVSAGKRTQSAMHIASVDGLQASSGYINSGFDTVVRYKSSRNGSYVAGVTWASVYHDPVNFSGSRNVIHMPDDGNASSLLFNISYSSCVFGGCPDAGFLIRKKISMLNIEGGAILNTGSYAIDYELAVAQDSAITINGTNLSNNSSAVVNGVIRLVNVTSVNLTPTIQTSTTGAVYNFGGTINRLFVGGTVSGTYGSLFSKTGTINSFNFSPSGINSVFTPTFAFSGGSTGLTFVATGSFSLNGGRCVGDLFVTLSNKGSSTGTLIIGGLPFAPVRNSPCALLISPVSATTGDTSLHANVNSATSTILLYRMVGGLLTQLTDAELTNTSIIQIHFDYAI